MRLRIEVKEQEKILFSGHFEEFPIIIGRASHCHIRLSEINYISSTHLVVINEGVSFCVYDLNSKNGIALESGQAVINQRFVKQGAIKICNKLTIKFTQEDMVDDSTTQKTELSKTLIAEQMAVVSNHIPTKPSVFVAPLPVEPLKNEKDHLINLVENIKLETPPMFKSLRPGQVSLQGVLAWGNDIMDVRQFRANDRIWIGGEIDAPIYLPGTKKPILLGRMNGLQGQLSLNQNIKWHLRRDGIDFSHGEDAAKNNVYKVSGGKNIFNLVHGDLFTCDLGNSVSLHLRYVANARFFIRRSWIENREEFKKAAWVSGGFHLLVALLLLISTPETKAPQVENVPPRFAKLLVEPPKMPLKAPIPEEKLEPKPPEPPPPVAEKKPEPPKPVPKPKAVKQAKTTPVKSKPVKSSKPAPPVEQVVNTPPKPTESEIAANSLMDAFSAAPAPTASGGNKAIKIEKNNNQMPAGSSGLMAGVSGALKSKGGQLQSGAGAVGGAASGKVGQFGYSNTPGGSLAGKRGVVGGVVGRPSLDDFNSGSNGLSDKEIMAVVNKYLSQIHRCYERALLNDSNLSGRVQYEWDITPGGVVTSVRVKRSEISGGDMLNSCVVGVFKSMKFPAAKNNQSTTANIGFPFGKEG